MSDYGRRESRYGYGERRRDSRRDDRRRDSGRRNVYARGDPNDRFDPKKVAERNNRTADCRRCGEARYIVPRSGLCEICWETENGQPAPPRPRVRINRQFREGDTIYCGQCGAGKPTWEYSKHQLNVQKYGGQPAKCKECGLKNQAMHGGDGTDPKRGTGGAVCISCGEVKFKKNYTKGQWARDLGSRMCRDCLNSKSKAEMAYLQGPPQFCAACNEVKDSHQFPQSEMKKPYKRCKECEANGIEIPGMDQPAAPTVSMGPPMESSVMIEPIDPSAFGPMPPQGGSDGVAIMPIDPSAFGPMPPESSSVNVAPIDPAAFGPMPPATDSVNVAPIDPSAFGPMPTTSSFNSSSFNTGNSSFNFGAGSSASSSNFSSASNFNFASSASAFNFSPIKSVLPVQQTRNEPAMPSQPMQPARPVQPAQPVQPMQPARPPQPIQPPQPAQPIQQPAPVQQAPMNDEQKRNQFIEQTQKTAKFNVIGELTTWINQSIPYIQQCGGLIDTLSGKDMKIIFTILEKVLARVFESRGLNKNFTLKQSVPELRKVGLLLESHEESFTTILDPAQRELAMNVEFGVDRKKAVLEVVWTLLHFVRDEILPLFSERQGKQQPKQVVHVAPEEDSESI